MALSHSTGLSNAGISSGIGAAFDTNGRLAIYSGAMPAGVAVGGKTAAANAANTGTKLAEFTLPADAFAAAASGAMALNAVSDTTGLATGTAGYFVFYNSTETAPGSAALATDKRLMGTIGTSGADMPIDNASIASGGVVKMSGWTYNHAP